MAYVGSQGRNLFLRSIANRTIGVQSNGAAAATQIREFDIVTARTTIGGVPAIASIQRPFAEIDYKTSGGHDSYNAMQLSLTKRSMAGLVLNAQYTLGLSKGNTGGSNEAATAANNARALIRSSTTTTATTTSTSGTRSTSAPLYEIPGRGPLTGGWSIGGIVNGRSGCRFNVLITRPDIVYVDGAGNVFANPAADRTAVINVPGGGATRNIRRPDLVPGVDPFIKDGGLLFLNPAAFATPRQGPSATSSATRSMDRTSSRSTWSSPRALPGGKPNAELRAEIFNLFDTVNFASPSGTLAQAIPTAALTEANRVQPGQPYTAAAAGPSFGPSHEHRRHDRRPRTPRVRSSSRSG